MMITTLTATRLCAICGERATMACSLCKRIFYCSDEHRVKDWKDSHQLYHPDWITAYQQQDPTSYGELSQTQSIISSIAPAFSKAPSDPLEMVATELSYLANAKKTDDSSDLGIRVTEPIQLAIKAYPKMKQLLDLVGQYLSGGKGGAYMSKHKLDWAPSIKVGAYESAILTSTLKKIGLSMKEEGDAEVLAGHIVFMCWHKTFQGKWNGLVEVGNAISSAVSKS